MENENTILYRIDINRAELLCKHFGKDINNTEEYEICELLDKLIDNYCN